MIRIFLAPIRKVLQFPLVQFVIVIVLILLLQAADATTVFGQIFDGLDKLVESSVQALSTVFTVRSFTRSALTFGLMIVYVYLACWALLGVARVVLRLLIDVIGRHNLFWLRSSIARERGAQAYRAWLPLERIRPDHVPQADWETAYAWPPNNVPPYPPFAQRFARGVIAYAVLSVVIVVLLQVFTPFPVLDWVEAGLKRATGI